MPTDKIFDAIFPPGNATIEHGKNPDGTEWWSFVSPAPPNDGTVPRDVKITRRKGSRKAFKHITSIVVKE